MQILKYIQSEEFGKHGESIKLVNNIQVSLSIVVLLREADASMCLTLANFLLALSIGIHE